MKYILQTFGKSKGNPGPAAAAWAIYKDIRNPYKKHKRNDEGPEPYVPPERYTKLVSVNTKFLGIHTTNYAEYIAILEGLKECFALEITSLRVKSNGDLQAKQLMDFISIKNENLEEIKIEIDKMCAMFDYVIFSHVYRYRNKDAMKAATECIKMNIDPAYKRKHQVKKKAPGESAISDYYAKPK